MRFKKSFGGFQLELNDSDDPLDFDHILIDVWKSSYPDVDIGSELKIIRAWIKSNPRKAPKKDYIRFCNNWFKKEQRKLQPSSWQVEKMRRCIEEVNELSIGENISELEWMERVKTRCSAEGLGWSESLMRHAINRGSHGI